MVRADYFSLVGNQPRRQEAIWRPWSCHAIGIEAPTDLAMPDVANRHADAQLAAPRFGAGGVEHAGAQHAELELADAALRDGDILPKNSPLTF